MYWSYGKGTSKSVLYREVVPFLEGPLSEAPLYSEACMITNSLHIAEAVSAAPGLRGLRCIQGSHGAEEYRP